MQAEVTGISTPFMQPVSSLVLCHNERDEMRELRDSIREWLKLHGRGEDYEYHAFHISELEAFAKAQRIKGMETAKRHVCAEMLGIWRIDKDLHRMQAGIDAEIAKLKEGG